MKHSVLSLLACLIVSASSAMAQNAEYVSVQKVADDKAVVVRGNGEAYVIEKGVGCISLPRFEGKKVIIASPGIFLGVGSKLVLPDVSQECRIWDSKSVGNLGVSLPPSSPSRTLAPQSYADQWTFFDSQARATAYIDVSGDLTIFLWSGEPVAYLDGDSIYGFNGKHLGWYARGCIYDDDGNVVAAPAAAFQGPVDPPPPRGLKSLKPLKGLKELKPLKPLFGSTWSQVPARAFFAIGMN